ncbi:MAG TPA: flagellar motor switch protein FliM [Anaerolineales bacterium]|nr:flagellar motor switch protein FliM [Anaerolineales bacterium]HMZ05974.1 flagellar motor switch protein FliM [Anaerolineales bacterium]HNA88913.1 flagellar motor switch protein FliM [Anaerolineales bacterium]HNC88368.1 flagellar motor switch protein FliM [Anaerolineales bacterium]HND91524.1 flagellar motor switch protein FliM [Anaerolineales bacterium]
MLAQSEIDALLSGAIDFDQKNGGDNVNLTDKVNPSAESLGPDGKREKKIQPYNFWSPARFSKEQMRAVELVHEDLSERLTTSLPTFLRTNVRPRLVHIEQGRFHDFIKDFPQNTLFHLISLAPLPGHMVLTMSLNVSYLILEQRLGGKIEGRFTERALTEIDQSLLRGLVEHMLGDMKGAWSKVVSLEPSLEDSTVNQHWVQMMIGNERVLLLTIEINIQGVTGTMSVFIPFNTLKPITEILNPHIWIAGRKEHQQDPVARQMAIQATMKAIVPVTVILGAVDLPLKELIHLAPGDVIELNTNIDSPLVVQVANKKQFYARVGKSRKRLGVQITRVYREQDEAQMGF